MYKWILIFLLIPSVCFGAEITTARGLTLLIKDDTKLYGPISFWDGTMENVHNVTFIRWNFSRKEPHTEVFINSTNLKFINCNLKNVELQEDFIVQSSLTVHERRYEALGIKYREQETKDNKIKTYRMEGENPTLISTKDLSNDKKIKVKYTDPNTGVVSSLNAISIIE